MDSFAPVLQSFFPPREPKRSKRRLRKRVIDSSAQENVSTSMSKPMSRGGRHGMTHSSGSSSGSVYSAYVDSRSASPVGSDDGYDSSLDTEISEDNSRAPSIYSYSSSLDGPEMLRTEHGRTFNAQSEVYYLPADEQEFDRLGLQHRIHSTVLGNLYPGAELVERVLAPEWGVEKTILDVGTGPGHWAIDMAKRFPHCHVVGVDLAPRTTFSTLPENLRLEFDDANLGFPHYHGAFDCVHARSVSNGINDYDDFVADLVRCLRPGGVLILIDGEPPILNHLRKPLAPAPVDGDYPASKGWFSRILFEAARNMASRGGRVLTDSNAALTHAMVATGELHTPVVHTMHIPLGPWPVGASEAETRWIRTIGEMMRRNALEFKETLRPMLRTQGFDEVQVAKMLANATRELEDLTVPMYTRWAYGYAIKPHPT